MSVLELEHMAIMTARKLQPPPHHQLADSKHILRDGFYNVGIQQLSRDIRKKRMVWQKN